MRFSREPASQNGYGGAFTVPTYRALQPQVMLELRRARRYEHPLGVAVLSLQPPPLARGARADGSLSVRKIEVTPAVYGLLGAYLRNTLRETDILTGLPEALAFATFLPGVDRDGARQALERMRCGFLECAAFAICGGTAAFPDDGLTIEDVLDRAREAWRQALSPELPNSMEPRYSHG